MGSLGMPEILMILVIALIIFGPRKLPELGKSLGQSLAHFRRASEDFKRQWEDEVAMERQRISPPDPSPVEHDIYSAGGAAESVDETTSTEEAPSNDQTGSESVDETTSTEEAPSNDQTGSESALDPQHVENTAQETKRDWM